MRQVASEPPKGQACQARGLSRVVGQGVGLHPDEIYLSAVQQGETLLGVSNSSGSVDVDCGRILRGFTSIECAVVLYNDNRVARPQRLYVLWRHRCRTRSSDCRARRPSRNATIHSVGTELSRVQQRMSQVSRIRYPRAPRVHPGMQSSQVRRLAIVLSASWWMDHG